MTSQVFRNRLKGKAPNKRVKFAPFGRWDAQNTLAPYPSRYFVKEKMKNLLLLVVMFSITSCAWVVVDTENQNADGSHFVRLSGNAFAKGSDMENKLNEYAEKKCGKDNYTYVFSKKDQQEMQMVDGNFYSMSKPWLDATIKCNN
ncbi:MAG: hypothetical protein PVJ39_15635 [Gammaproteobacteria bacterium]